MALRIIPKIDVKNKNMVKGVHLEGLRALGDPRSFIEIYYKDFADEIIFHDVVASLYQRNSTPELIKYTSRNIFLPFLVGGGITTLKEIERILLSGADRIFINTAALNNYNFLLEAVKNFGSSTIVLSIEVINENSKYLCRKDFGREKTNTKFEDWFRKGEEAGVGEILITSIDRDGTGQGFDEALSEKIAKLKSLTPFIINGGFGTLEHIKQAVEICNPSAIALGSMLHYSIVNKAQNLLKNTDGNFEFKNKKTIYKNFGRFSIQDIKNYLTKNIKTTFRE
jgi:cyclase